MVQSLSTAFDVAIIGAGVVGCAVARRFALAGAKVVIIEKGSDILSGASKANSAILHTGFDAPEGSLELELVKAGRAEYLSIHRQMGLSLVETGALVCAWNPDEAQSLEAIAEQGRRNGIAELGLLTARQARESMPGLSDRLVAALEVPGEHVIDPWSAPLGYLTQAVALGAQLVRNAEVLSGAFDGAWRIETTAGPILAASVVNAAGLFGDIVLPVPTEITKGIVVCPTAFGNVLIGPTAEEQDDRERATVETAALEALLTRGREIVPALASIPVTAIYAGLRPASEKKHYRISARPDRRAITLGGVRSTGLSAALGLAQHALALHESFGTRFMPPPAVPHVTMPNLSETCERDWQRADYGEIVCHCELVTRREIEATFSSPVPPGDFGGLRRRTRAGMGRCQGFYCNARLAAMTGDRLAVPLAVRPGDDR